MTGKASRGKLGGMWLPEGTLDDGVDFSPLPEKQAEKDPEHTGEIVANRHEAGRRCKPERQPHP